MNNLSKRLFGTFDQASFTALESLLKRGWAKNFPMGLAIMNNNIRNFDPPEDFKGGRPTSLDSSLGLAVRHMLSPIADLFRRPQRRQRPPIDPIGLPEAYGDSLVGIEFVNAAA